MPKATTPTSARQGRRHNPLEDDLLATGILRPTKPKRKSKDNTEEEHDSYVSDKASRQILKIGRELAEENDVAPPRPPVESNAFGFESRGEPEEEDNEPFEDETWGDEDEVVEEVEIDPEDLDTFKRFLPEEEDPISQHEFWGDAQEPHEEQGGGGGSGGGTNLADLILAKIAAHEAGAEGGAQEMGPVDEDYELSPKIVEVYTKIGMILGRYKSGKLPKPFKILPTVPNWETIIQLTKPESWTPNAVYEATRIFVSGKPAVARRFMEMILLDHVRSDIYETKKLNVHLFNAVKKSLYKPAAFFKGFLFPLVEDGCSLREATIISAVLARISIPVLHSGAAIKALCDIAAREASAGTEGGGATNVLIRTLLEKKYALPYQVIDSLVFHFLRFRSVDPASVQEGQTPMDTTTTTTSTGAANNNNKLPVIWHQCLLSFAQRYRNEITEDQREALLDLLLTHGHHKIGPEIRRELLAGRGRGVAVEPPGPQLDGDDTLMLVD
ncbi:Bystin-domain-containing protein [Xylariomycetidae sp. FL2044]|nr:Bystin-domain-containing protein [Xylariomycetidae sp. FL2044]